MTENKQPTDIDSYIHSFPPDIARILQRIREIIHQAVPEATETISYGMPTFKLDGKPLVYFAGWKEHIGFYATPSGNQAFREELSKYQGAKGSVRFPLDQPIPYDLIARIADYRGRELRDS